MPSEYTSREGHPYRYGYGKLVHSGYHFVDLFAWLVFIPSRTLALTLVHKIASLCQQSDLNREFCSPSSPLPITNVSSPHHSSFSDTTSNSNSSSPSNDPYFSIYSTRYRPLDAMNQLSPRDIHRLFQKRAEQLSSAGIKTHADIPAFPSSFHVTPQALSSLQDITPQDQQRMSQFGNILPLRLVIGGLSAVPSECVLLCLV
jgi:hypothetical protein